MDPRLKYNYMLVEDTVCLITRDSHIQCIAVDVDITTVLNYMCLMLLW